MTLSSVYPLGLWRGWAYVHFPLAGIVYPAPESDAPPLPPGAVGHDANATARGDDADLAGLRDYQPGDPMQRIAWKAVARGAGWHTKQFEGAGGGGPVELAWQALPRGARRRGAARPPHRVGARRRARGAAVRAVAARDSRSRPGKAATTAARR